MTRIVDGQPTESPRLHAAGGQPTEPDADAPEDATPGPPGEDRPDERPLATGRLDLPTGFPFEGNAHILVLSTASEQREATVGLLRRDGDAGWDVDAAGTRETVRAKLALETYAVVILFADHGDLAPQRVVHVIESTRRWPAPAVVVLLDSGAGGDRDPPTAEDLGAFRVLAADGPEAELVEAVRQGVRRDAIRARPPWDTEIGPASPTAGDSGDDSPA